MGRLMAYEYDATEEERAAEALLREKGWSVSEPACPKCHGRGWIARITETGTEPFITSTYTTDPCPNGCPTTWAFYSTSNTVTTGPLPRITADGTVGMRRGVL